MGAITLQHPPHLIGFIGFIVMTVFSIIALGLAGSVWWLIIGGLHVPARGLGIFTGVVGMLGGLAGIAWLLIEELWTTPIFQMALWIGCFVLGLFCFITFIVMAAAGGGGIFGAAAAFQFFLFVICGALGFLCFRVIEGGSASSPSSFGSSSSTSSKKGASDEPQKEMEISAPH